MLQGGLDHILKRFEVVDVRNRCGNPGRIGLRFVEVLVVVIVSDGREKVPHVCEIRLEPLHFHTATSRSANAMAEFWARLKHVYLPTHMDMNAVEFISNNALMQPAEPHRLRRFRCHLGRRFGSTICAWRKALGGGRLVSFQRFREVCYTLQCAEHVTELWQQLDPNRGGCISLWELDPDAVSLLMKLRCRMLEVVGSIQKGEVDLEEVDVNVLWVKLTSFAKPKNLGSLERHEFRLISEPLGLTMQEADRAFACLDRGSQNPPALVDITDIHWLKRLPSLLDTEAIQCAQDVTEVVEDPLSPLSGAMNAWETPRAEKRKESPSTSKRQEPAAAPKKAPTKQPQAPSKPQSPPPTRGQTPPPTRGPQTSAPTRGPQTSAPTKANPWQAASPTEDLADAGVDEDVEDDDDEEYDEEAEEEEPEDEDDYPDEDEDEEDEDDDGEPAKTGEETW